MKINPIPPHVEKILLNTGFNLEQILIMGLKKARIEQKKIKLQPISKKELYNCDWWRIA